MLDKWKQIRSALLHLSCHLLSTHRVERIRDVDCEELSEFSFFVKLAGDETLNPSTPHGVLTTNCSLDRPRDDLRIVVCSKVYLGHTHSFAALTFSTVFCNGGKYSNRRTTIE